MFVLNEETAVVRTMDLHNAAMAMAVKLGLKGSVTAAAGDFLKKGWQSGFVGKPSKADVHLEVFATPHGGGLAMMDTVLLLASEVDRLTAPGRSQELIQQAIVTRSTPNAGAEHG